MAPTITEPRIYFGDGADNYVIVKGSTPEFDYPKGNDNVYTTYDGTDGVAIGGYRWRTLFAWHFGDLNILLSRYITGESQILFHRNIQDRVRTIAPFLHARSRPLYRGQRRATVLDAGRLYHQRLVPLCAAAGRRINYIRNAVKVVIDAYNGTVTFYVTDPADPIIATYQRIFPDLFKPLDAMPPDLQQHIRYPEDLFQIQAQLYRAYHMDAPEVFYNREDLWQFPREPAGIDGGSALARRMTPTT